MKVTLRCGWIASIVIALHATAFAAIQVDGRPARNSAPAAEAGSFEENRGQSPTGDFLLRTPTGIAAISTRGFTFTPWNGVGPEDVLTLEFGEGVDCQTLSGVDQTPQRSNYLIGRDSSSWVTAVKHYQLIRCGSVVPKIDLVYRVAAGGRLRFDMEVAAGADLDAFSFKVHAGPTAAEIERSGDLAVKAPVGHYRLSPPIACSGELDCKPVLIDYHRDENDVIRFQTLGWDRASPLRIDPTLVYSVTAGGEKKDEAQKITAGPDGSVYIAGRTTSTRYPVSAEAFQPFLFGTNAYVTKLAPDGSGIVWATYLGGTEAETPNAIALGSDGSVFVAGVTSSFNFPVTPSSASSLALFSGNSGFVSKLTADGTNLTYSTFIGGAGYLASGHVGGMAIDSQGRAYVSGTGYGLFPYAGPQIQSSVDPIGGVFVSRLSADGSEFEWLTLVGPGSPTAIALGPQDDVFIAGNTNGQGFPTTAGALLRQGADIETGFVVRVSQHDLQVRYSTLLGGLDVDSDRAGQAIEAMSVDGSGAVTVCGHTGSMDFPVTAGALQTIPSTEYGLDAFITRLSPDGDRLLYSTLLGGNFEDWAKGLALLPDGAVAVAGTSTSGNFPLLRNDLNLADDFETDLLNRVRGAFVVVLSSRGDSLDLAARIDHASEGVDTFADSNGSVYVIGTTSSPEFPGTPLEPVDLTTSSNVDFIVRFEADSARPSFRSEQVTHAATFLAGSVSPGQIATIFGDRLGPQAGAAGRIEEGLLSSALGGVQVLVNGIAAPLYYVGAGQINFQVPYAVAGSTTADVVVIRNGLASDVVSVPVSASSPGFFVHGDGSMRAAAINENGLVNSPANPASIGGIVTLFGTGEGLRIPAAVTGQPAKTSPLALPALPVSVTIDGQAAEVLYAGAAPNFVGLLQLNVRIPPATSIGDAVHVYLTVGEAKSTAATLLSVR